MWEHGKTRNGDWNLQEVWQMLLWLRDFPGWRVGQDARPSCPPGEVGLRAGKPALLSLEASTVTLGLRFFPLPCGTISSSNTSLDWLNIPFKTYLWGLWSKFTFYQLWPNFYFNDLTVIYFPVQKIHFGLSFHVWTPFFATIWGLVELIKLIW